MTNDQLEQDLRAAWDEVYRPAPWLLSRSMSAVRQSRPSRRIWAWAAGIAAALVAISSIAIFESIRLGQTSRRGPTVPANTSLLPQPVPQPITRTSAGAQVAWVSMQAQGQQPSLVGVDPNGRIVARLDESTTGWAAVYGIWRSADGSEIFTASSNRITAYSASDGKPLRSYPSLGGDIINDTFSPDGHWLAVLFRSTDLQLEAINLQTGATQAATVERNSKATSGVLVFSADSSRVYTLTGWEGPLRLTAFGLSGDKPLEIASGVSGEQGRSYPTCAGPAIAAKIIAGQTLVAFCHVDGAVWFFDLTTLESTGIVQSHQENPFWISPIFTPDGHLLYLHQMPGFGDTMQVVNLATRQLLGPFPTPTRLDQGGPFAWLFTNAYAGGVASTVPISPDGLRLYSATGDGVMVLRVPDLKPLSKLAPGFRSNEVWISGDGQTVYATSVDGRTLAVMRADGSSEKTITLPSLGGGFIASEHG